MVCGLYVRRIVRAYALMLFIVQPRPVAVAVGIGIDGENDIGDHVVFSVKIFFTNGAVIVAHVAFGRAGCSLRRDPFAVNVAGVISGGEGMRGVIFHQAAFGAGIIIFRKTRAGGGGNKRIIVCCLRRKAVRRVLNKAANRAGADVVGGIQALIRTVGMLLCFVIAGDGQVGSDVCKVRIPRAEEMIMHGCVPGFLNIFRHLRRSGVLAVEHGLRINRIAVGVNKGDGILCFELQADIDCIRAHRTGKRAFRNPDVHLAGSSLDIADLIGIFKIDRLPEIIHVVRHEIAVHVHIERTVAADAASAGTTVQPAVDVEIILVPGPVHIEIRLVINAPDIVRFLRDHEFICGPGYAELHHSAVLNGLAAVGGVIPVAWRKTGAGDVRRVIRVAVNVIHIDIRTRTAILKPELKAEQIPVPGENGIIIGGAADLHAPGIFAVIAREAGGILEIAV